MFKKLVANLPFNPSLINQVGFYADRLRQEKSIRRLGFVFMALTMIVQSFAVVAPPQRSFAAESSHIIQNLKYEQFANRKHILDAYDNKTSDRDVKQIFSRFNITRQDIANLTYKPNDTISPHYDSINYRTIGRGSIQSNSQIKPEYKTGTNGERKIQYAGQETKSTTSDDKFVYNRALAAWDIKYKNSYKAWKGKSSKTGQTFWILQNCGNITWIGSWEEPKNPELYIKKSQSTKKSLNPGDELTYTIEYRNKVIGSEATNVVIRDELDTKNFDVLSPKNLNINANGVLVHRIGNLKGSNSNKFLKIKVRLKNPLTAKKVCNAARISADNASAVNSSEVCNAIIKPCKYDPSLPSNDPNCKEPVVACSVVDAAVDRTLRRATFKTTVESSNPDETQIISYVYNFGDGSEELTKNSSELTDTQVHTYEPGEYTTNVYVNYKTTGVNSTKKTDACSAPIDFEEDSPLGEMKELSNITQELEGEEALNSKVQAGDVIEYSLTTLNTQNYARVEIKVQDYIGDILEYADLDEDFLSEQGGTYDEEEMKVIWENVTVPANSEVVKKFRVVMKDPIPATNRPSDESTNYDCVITNFYGNEVELEVACPAVKGIETLPNTGPGTSLAVTAGITMAVGYFFARSRLLAKEIDLIRSDYAATGGA